MSTEPKRRDAAPAESVRGRDPNVCQRGASDPERSVWVGASAGTGKTKVLTDRVLRLLLPHADGRPGTPPHRILCLTFTRAAANEMLQRIGKVLGEWATLAEDDPAPDKKGLKNRLKSLTGREPGSAEIEAARRLFAAVIDAPGGLKVMTIHSFCQSILGRFPLEAGLSPHFSIIDEGPAQALLAKARDNVLARARQNPDGELGKAVRDIAAEQNEDQFGKLLRGLCSERLQLEAMPEDGRAALCQIYALAADDSEDSLLEAACRDSAFDRAGLHAACKALAASSNENDRKNGLAIQNWLDAGDRRADGMNAYQAVFLTVEGDARKKLATKAVLDSAPEVSDILAAESKRLLDLNDALKAVKCVNLTCNLLVLGRAIIAEYQRLKEGRGVLDYDDLILKTRALLGRRDISPWILFKLDGGLDHILIDEAQDTNPEQWEIIRTLCEDFFSGESARSDAGRTLFTVGDEKQSIYSFQRAAPREFERMRAYFAARTQLHEENMVVSFRSGESVLALVDAVFAPSQLSRGLGIHKVEHESFRKGQAGLAELWPVFSPDETHDEDAPWSPPTRIIEAPSGQARLAEHIGKTIKDWLGRGEILESQDRPVQPGDIMILVRTRTAFVNQLVRALKTRKIPVSGIDRMVLGQQLAVMDLLAAAQFALLPDDDLSLACLLKSPLIGLDEDALFQLAYGRDQSLWARLQEREPALKSWLKSLIAHAAADQPYEFFSRLLQRPCPADEVSGLRAMLKRLGEDARDPLDEFLNAALLYERENIPTLQGFLIWQQQEDITIKRELEEAGTAVRIMTVHGAKGLQAPIVILPDTVRTASSKKPDLLLWPDKTGHETLLWAPRSKDFPGAYRKARAQLDDEMEQEYRRLLYVALTRAEDRLYIAGCQGKKKPLDESWYNYIAEAFDQLKNTEEREENGLTVRRLYNPQTKPPDKPATAGEDEMQARTALPAWAHARPEPEPHPPRPMMPSRPAAPEPAVRSPLENDGRLRFRRGTITHKLLQFLPELPPDRRAEAAARFLAQPAHRLPENLQNEILAETLAITQNPAYAALFSARAMAEVPLTGYVGGRLISAQIDRLLVTEEEILIVDFKTNRPPPETAQEVVPIYRDQLSAYRDIVASIWPDRPVRCFLLWTDGPRLMELTGL